MANLRSAERHLREKRQFRRQKKASDREAGRHGWTERQIDRGGDRQRRERKRGFTIFVEAGEAAFSTPPVFPFMASKIVTYIPVYVSGGIQRPEGRKLIVWFGVESTGRYSLIPVRQALKTGNQTAHKEQLTALLVSLYPLQRTGRRIVPSFQGFTF